eukprot:TRINITY_DN76680_c0_g1_i1.p1 TRINITY_DN76680_c0_g1~~TRINITY_DN76680_c0_g1_i1.p1  ORF type:complete len:600 (-),score=188.61 TRINITY_DN76680_c0_g1_i1:72-1871(-)
MIPLGAPATASRRGSSWQPPRAYSSPSLQEAAHIYAAAHSPPPPREPGGASVALAAALSGGFERSSGTVATPRVASSRRSRAAASNGEAAWGLMDSDCPTAPNRSARSTERSDGGRSYKEESHQLRVELAEKKAEAKQLKHRVKLLEGSLGVRMQELELLAEELRSVGPELSAHAATGVNGECRRLGELLDRIVREARRTQVLLHVHADNGALLEAKDRLLEQAQSDRETKNAQLMESRMDARRLAAKVRQQEQQQHIQQLHSARKSQQQEKRARRAISAPQRPEDDVAAAYEKNKRQLQGKVKALNERLEEEKAVRKEQERIAAVLATQLEDMRRQREEATACPGTTPALHAAPPPFSGTDAADAASVPVDPVYQHTMLGRRFYAVQAAPPTLERSGCASASSSRPASPSRPATAPAQRQPPAGVAARRDASSDADAAPSLCNKALVGASSANSLRKELEALRGEERAARRQRRQEQQDSDAGIDEGQRRDHLETLLAAAEVTEATLREELAAAVAAQHEERCRSWSLAAVANELAWEMDVRQLEALELQVEAQRELQAAELRCATMAAIANGLRPPGATMSIEEAAGLTRLPDSDAF